MKRFVCTLLVAGIAFLFVGCPPKSSLTLAGDADLVGTWVADYELLGYHIHSQSTLDALGNFTTVMTCQEDSSIAVVGGKWYVDPEKGLSDSVCTWTNPKNPSLHGTQKGYYEVNGDTRDAWTNPVNMDRPATREQASLHVVWTRVQEEEKDAYGVAASLLEFSLQ